MDALKSKSYPRMIDRTFRLLLPMLVAASALALWVAFVRAAPLRPQAAVFCVKPGGGDGCEDAIQDALDLAQPGDTILVAAGVYKENVLISQTVTLQGGWDETFSLRDLDKFSSTILPADETVSVVFIHGEAGDTGLVAPTLDGFEITGGRADLGSNHGGGLSVVDSNALVISNTITDNTAFLLGGGVWVQHGAPVLQGNQITNNQSVGLGQEAHGGGVQLENTQAALMNNLIASNVVSGTLAYGGGIEISGTGVGQVVLKRNLFISNTASIDPSYKGYGGALAVSSGQALLEGSSVISNTAVAAGGGLWIGASGVFSLTDIAVVANLTGGEGGGIYNTGFISITNATISGNDAKGMGGGIANFEAIDLVNATITGNASANGAGVFNASSVNTLNSLIALNSGGNCLGAMNSLGHNLEDGGTCALGQPTDMSNTPPSIDQLADNGGDSQTHALLADSPAIDAGDNANCPSMDQRGSPRPADGDGDGQAVCDIGAFEFGFMPLYLPLLIR